MAVRLRRMLFAGVIFWSALLLLVLQPVLTKAILPWFGGSAGVWTTSMLFFQALLLLGYLYAHLLNRRLTVRHQVTLHGALLFAAALTLPVVPAGSWKPQAGVDPSAAILGLLAVSAGLPYFLLSTTSPLLQAWYSRVFRDELPYRLYAVSNLGSLVALLSYPFLVEPYLPVSFQLGLWSAGFVIFAVACGVAGAFCLREGIQEPQRSERPQFADVATWFALAMVPSVLWLAVGNQISQDVAAVPFLWIVPLALYLLTFVICFDRDGFYPRRLMRWVLPVAWAAIVLVVSQQGYLYIKQTIPALMLALFLCCLFCHGELARLRPDPARLTAYYLTMAAGGATGGLFVGIIAPRIFTDYLELPFGLAACVLLALWLLYGLSSKRAGRIAFVVAAAAIASLFVNPKAATDEHRIRNFYGTLRIAEDGQEELHQRALFNGSIQHGLQFLEEGRTGIPTTYYGPSSGAAVALQALQERGPVRVGVVGLGVGTMAAYGRKGDTIEFYEINPAVVEIARTQFRYLKDTPATVRIHHGDARLTMSAQEPKNFDLLVIDAFSGDSIPVHLLTREAFVEYFRHVAAHGAVAVHTTNKHLELEPVVQLAAASQKASSLLIHNTREPARGIYVSSWIIVTRNSHLQSQLAWMGSPIPRNGGIRLWTDDFSNLLTIIR